MNIISIHDIVELNHLLVDELLFFKIHIRDACGKQSLWIEPLKDSMVEEQYQKLDLYLNHYFEKKGFQIVYGSNKLDFWIE